VLNFYDDLIDAHYKWVNSAMPTGNRGKENKWPQSIAVGSKTFIDKMKEALGFRAKGRKKICAYDTFELREVLKPYGEANNQDSENTFSWDQPIDWLRIYRQPPSLISQFLYEN
jgi:putative transposase